MQINFLKNERQSGQTLIETLAAAFILVMGVTAASGLAIFAYSSSTGVVKQIIATGLAREGVEVVKNMRDTNWLQDTLQSNCYDFATGTNTASCYPNWLTAKYNIKPATAGTNVSYVISFDPSTFWTLTQQNSNFALDFASTPTQGYYIPTSNSLGTSGYYRKIVLYRDTTGAFSQSGMEKLTVKVEVWWTDKHCPPVSDYTPGMNCSLELDHVLTNWKNYY